MIGTGFGAPELTTLTAVRLELDAGAGDPLRDRIVADLAVTALAERGIVLTPDAEVALIAHGFVSENEHWVPPETRFVQRSQPFYTRSYCGNGRWITRSHPMWVTDTVIIPGHTVREYSHRAELVLQMPGGKVLWMGELRADGRTPDFVSVMKTCLPLLLVEFPEPSGQASPRRVLVTPSTQ